MSRNVKQIIFNSTVAITKFIFLFYYDPAADFTDRIGVKLNLRVFTILELSIRFQP